MMISRLYASLIRAHLGEPPDVAADDASAFVLMADGCGGLDLCQLALRHVAAGSGRSVLVRPVAWNHGVGRWHADLVDVANHKAWSRSVADEVLAWRNAHPSVPVYLVGKSAGAGIMVGALEGLPEGSVEAAVLLAPALSPGYDLSPALRAVRREVVVFWSPLDAIILGAGTWLFGTVDRVRSVASGFVGFRMPGGLDDEGVSRYAKLRQVRWRPSMAATGYLGGHIGPDLPAFLRGYIMPLLTGVGDVEMLNFPRDQAHPTPRR